MLTQERLKEVLDYDPETGLFRWKVVQGKLTHFLGRIAGSPTNQGYIGIVIDYRRYKAHRLAWLYVHGVWPTHNIDHRNRVKDDNRISNLREATKAQNEQNKPENCKNTSGRKGVYWNKWANKWQAYIKQGGRAIYLGQFEKFHHAVFMRETAEKEMFGEFAECG